VNGLLSGLLPVGLREREVVAWLGLNTPLQLQLLDACIARGAVLMPLNWRLAPAELAAQLRHAGATHLLHDRGHADLAAALRPALAPPGPADGIETGDALLVYTSGTTGEPKGALHTVAGIAANVAAAVDAQGLTSADRVLAVLPMFHAGGLAIQVLPAWRLGAGLQIHPRFDAEAWFDAVEQWRPTTSLLVPAVMRALVEHARWPGADLSSLRFVNSGSQIVPRALIEAFHARGVPVAQVYGASETGPVSLVLRPEEARAQVGCVGRPALGVQVRLGPDGEILLKAPNLMRRYHRQVATGLDAEGWFATGDLAVEHPGGWFEVVGRSKELIISGGENIHPDSIEQLVHGWPGIAEAAVVGLPDERWGEVPVLAVVLHPGATLDEAALRTHLAGRLARFKLPRHVVRLDGLPRTALGKVARDPLRRDLVGRVARAGGET
jgi:fatty-acyl-CoA synthase